jgi:CDP-diacylglycerol--glycerol-3-phosphate 3-phosphatidyltransferase
MTDADALQANSPDSLRRRWWIVAFLTGLLLLAGFLFLRDMWRLTAAVRWVILAGSILAVQLAFLWRHLPENCASDAEIPWSTFGLANLITIGRCIAAAALTGLLALPMPPGHLVWLAAILHAAAVIPDFFDGYIARITGHVSVLGGRLDMEADSLAMLAATLLSVHYGFMPPWFAAVGFARYLYVFGLWLRTRRGLPVYDLSSSRMRRPVAGLMMGFANLALWPILDERVMALAGLILAVPLLGGFVRDWLVVSGCVDPAGSGYTRLFAQLDRSMSLLLPALRILASIVVLMFLLPAVLRTWAAPLSLLLASVVIIAVIMLVFGAAARLAAVALLAVGLLDLVVRGFQPYQIALAFGALPVLLFGPGQWALWKPEEPPFVAPIGKRRAHDS